MDTQGLRNHLQKIQSKEWHVFLEKLTTQSKHLCWEHSEQVVEKGMEIWIHSLSQFGSKVCLHAASAAGRYAYPFVVERGGEMALECGVLEESLSMDGESAGKQLRRVEAWLADATEENRVAVEQSIDPSRQLQVWDEDLYPTDDLMWFWFLEVGQLCAQACICPNDQPHEECAEPYTWSRSFLAARAAICASKSIQVPNGDRRQEVAQMMQYIVQKLHALCI